MKKSMSLLLALVIIFVLGAATKVDAKSTPAYFSKKYITINAGKTVNMKSYLKNAGKYTITWRSSNTKVASVNRYGKVTAKKNGTAKIKAYIKQKRTTISCKVTVKSTSKTKAVSGKYRTLRVKCTAYCPCRRCSGGYGSGTATGRRAVAGRTIAVDPRVIPLGSKVVIDGHTYIAEDTGVRGHSIDIYMNSHSKCNAWGVRYRTVKVYRK